MMSEDTRREFDPNRPVQTRDGRAARVLCTDASGDYPVVALITQRDGRKTTSTHTATGHAGTDGLPRADDLVNVPARS
jgi:hypothetical protein